MEDLSGFVLGLILVALGAVTAIVTSSVLSVLLGLVFIGLGTKVLYDVMEDWP
jgi:hypothetical protein